jgi:hypothetical protein
MDEDLRSQPMNNSLRGEIVKLAEQNTVVHVDAAFLGQHFHSINTVALADQILELVASKMPEWKDEAYYTKHPVTWKPVAPEGNAEHYAAGFNQAIDSVKSILKGETQ